MNLFEFGLPNFLARSCFAWLATDLSTKELIVDFLLSIDISNRLRVDPYGRDEIAEKWIVSKFVCPLGGAK